ncbi:Malate/L-lactate dehydrogenase family-containing protein [Strongyloides ratti]|uniref:Malate/L-lactate dehydrogenase family-containing protein n=1 Tax=Strongyloides ratti TaxID=34506 RepID=A0A090LBA8_STRRB|nr:Malate/L-lactate dehydrogenase family-containing protein [Strongyloides ratti]CEF64785.1 Malate/L-lactate dehydrogenase family-containing protein [Strongyloides ratti]
MISEIRKEMEYLFLCKNRHKITIVGSQNKKKRMQTNLIIRRYKNTVASKLVSLETILKTKKLDFKDYQVSPIKDVKRYIVDCMKSVGTDTDHAKMLADVLVKGDNRGHYSHGINRLEMYMRDVKTGACKGKGEPKILNDFAATSWVDGNNLLGPVVGNFCTNLAIEKAKNFGISLVSSKGSNHYGIAGYYTLKCIESGMIGISMTNTSPLMFPTRSGKTALGTNPISFGAKGNNDDSFVLDMATTTAAVGKIELSKRKNIKVPNTWGADKTGNVSTDPSEILDGGGLLPLGGMEELGGYKGTGLAAMVELLCGILSGGTWGPHVRKWMSTTKEANLGQVFIAINPKCFAPDFQGRVQDLIDTMRNLPKANKNGLAVEVAGDNERIHEIFVEKLGGIPYHPNQISNMKDIAEKYGIKPFELLGKVDDLTKN